MDADINREPFFTFERIWWAYVIVTMVLGTRVLAVKAIDVWHSVRPNVAAAAEKVAIAEPTPGAHAAVPTPIPIVNDDTGETWGMIPPKGAKQFKH